MKRVIILRPDGAKEDRVDKEHPGLKKMQALVGGLIEPVPHFDSYEGQEAEMWVNEEGRLEGLPLNEQATKLWLEVLGKGPFRYNPELFGVVVIIARVKDEAEKPSRADLTQRSINRADRLARLLKLNAPDLILNRELGMLIESMAEHGNKPTEDYVSAEQGDKS